MIVGITGTFSSGQDTLGRYLQEHFGFLCVSTSDIIREVAMQQRGSIERPILLEVGNELRRKYGGSVLVERALDRYHNSIKNYSGVAITGIRSLGEASKIKTDGGVIVFTDAAIEIRYERMKQRARDAEAVISLAEFTQREQQEANTGTSETDFNREQIKAMADVLLDNSAAPEQFFATAVEKLGLNSSAQRL